MLLFPACRNDSLVEDQLGELSRGCLVNSDCRAPLVCAFERCHVECVTTRDCDGVQRCVGAREVERVCQLELEASCKTTADCAEGLVCGADGGCRDTCDRDEHCIGEQLCTKGVCAEPEELDESGDLPQTLPQRTCGLSSDCPLGSRCEAGVCLPECRDDRDCASGSACQAGACVAPSAETCDTSDDCRTAGQQCVGGSCRCECREDVDCALGASCDGCACSAAPASECTSSDDCEPGRHCVDGVCRCGCVEDRDCDTESHCDGCACQPIPDRSVVEDATLYESGDVTLMSGIVEVKGRLRLRGPYLKNTAGLEGLQTVGELEIYGMNLVADGPEGGNLWSGLTGLTLVRGNLSISTTNGVTSLKVNPALRVGGDVLIESTQLNCEQLYELELMLKSTGFKGSFVERNNTGCNGTCSAGVCYPPG
jgi:hypothetical protein